MMILGRIRPKSLCGILTVALITCGYTLGQTRSAPVDPGVRGGAAGAGGPLQGLTADETAFFLDGQARFAEIEVVNKGANNGLGPRFNSNQCFSCHSQPNMGGTSPAKNPLPEVAALDGAKNAVPWFIVPNGPIREARFKKSNGNADGEVHDLFVITGRADAPGCNIAQFDFLPAGNPLTGQGGNQNIIFRIPTPVFGAGLIEAISDSAILANQQANASAKSELGIHGHANAHLSGNVNLSANDGTITRFGWKAQNKSLLMFAGEAYNVEMGISNQLFPQERDETPGCIFNPTPNDTLNFTTTPSTTGNSSGISNPAVISRHRSVFQLHADARSAHARSTHTVQRKGTRLVCEGWVCALPYTVVYHRSNDCERLRDQSECCAFQSNCESFLRPARASHGQRPGRRHYARRRRPRRVPNCSSLGRRTTRLLPP